MSNKLTPVSRRELIRRLRTLGFEGPFPGSKHDVMARGDDSVIVPNSHRGEDISVDLLTKVLKQAGISRQDWLNAK
ncbi:MAG: type II toxin-antitoxin system HicA family toxin [Methanotrichaceae archaeon]|nr:type II toxin-antitoxin system HicA family toxin [Methanotrichaceae archaeon]